MKRCILLLFMIMPIAGCAIFNEKSQSENDGSSIPEAQENARTGENTKPPNSKDSDPNFAGTTIRAKELRKGKRPIRIPQDERREVDLNSIITIVFSGLTTERSTTENTMNKTFRKIREHAERLKTERDEINGIEMDKDLTKSDKDKRVQEIQNATDDFNKEAIAFLKRILQPHFEDQNALQEMLLEYGETFNVYANIISWATDQIEESLYKVGVEALLYKRGATPQPLAIREYNSLEEGKLRSDTPLIGISTENLQRVADELRRIQTAAKSNSESNSGNDPNIISVKDENKKESDELSGAAGKALQKVNHLLSLDIAEGNPARIDLSRTSAQEGDHVDVIVSFYRKEKAPSAVDADKEEMKAIKTITYPLEIIRAGINHRTAVDVIFARADQSKNGDTERKNWKLNAAASVNWFYRFDNPEDSTKKVMNWLRPGLGLHLAGLDMSDDESLEFGIGPSFSLWGGLLVSGFGWNLSEDSDRTYYYVGVDLIHLLTEAQGLGK